MAHITKLVCNHIGWTSPSGGDCKSLSPHLFEHNGFGYEEWLFRGFHQTINGENYYLGFIQGFQNHANANQIGTIDIYLSTTLYPDRGNCLTNTKRIIGKLEECSYFSPFENPAIANGFFDENNVHVGIGLLANEAHGLFDIQQRPFNVKFKRGFRYQVPAANQKWNFLNVPHGIIQYLPDNFVLEHQIPENFIDQYLLLNGNMPQILFEN